MVQIESSSGLDCYHFAKEKWISCSSSNCGSFALRDGASGPGGDLLSGVDFQIKGIGNMDMRFKFRKYEFLC